MGIRGDFGHFTKTLKTLKWTILTMKHGPSGICAKFEAQSNFSGTQALHILSGNLSHQIEHHLFRTMPANRYAQVAPKIKALCAGYGIHYNEASFIKQFSSVWVKLAKYSLPNECYEKSDPTVFSETQFEFIEEKIVKS